MRNISFTPFGFCLALAFALCIRSTPSAAQPVNDDVCHEHVDCGPIEDHPSLVLAFWQKDDNLIKAETLIGAGPQEPMEPVITPDSDEFGYALMPTPYAEHELSSVTGMLVDEQSGTPTHCTASIIRSRSKSLVLTARHCIRSNAEWFAKAMFIPAYNSKAVDGKRMPYGAWVVRQSFVPADYHDQSMDMALLSVYPAEDGGTLEDTVGAALSPLTTLDESFGGVVNPGYPGTYPYTNRGTTGLQHYCLSIARPSEVKPDMLATPHCSATQGDSGGPIIAYTPDETGGQKPAVVAIVSGKVLPRLQAALFCPLYQAAEGSTPPQLAAAACDGVH